MKDYLKNLNPPQLEAATYEGQSLLILAGAGSGKTRVITTRIAWLIDEKQLHPRSILAVTFTNKAASEMRERVDSMLHGRGSGAMIRTFHSFGAWFLRVNAHLTPDLDQSFTIYDDNDSLSLLQTIFPDKQKKKLSPYSKWISRAKDYCLNPDDDLSNISSAPDFPEVYAMYEKRLREVGNLDFGGLISRSVELLQKNEGLRKQIRQRFRIVMVDEYQDSNIAQYKLLKLLSGEGNSVCVVGDDDQSIYKFRGAEVENILSFPKEFPNTKIIKLEQNYRSTAPILKIASEVVSKNKNRLGKTLWTDKKTGEKARLVYLSDHRQEAEFCAELLQDGNLKGTAILYRTNAQSMSFETCFSRRHIPYKVVGALRFLEREEVKDIIAMLSFFNNQRDAVAFHRIINKPARGIGGVSLKKINSVAEETNADLLTAAKKTKLSKKANEGISNFKSIIDFMEESIDYKPLGEFTKEVIERTGLLSFYKSKDETTALSKENNLSELVSAASNYGTGRRALVDFLQELELDRETIGRGKPNNEEDAVTLITMHNTKGLEFDRVIITGLEEGLFPSGRENSIEELEEERRIFYVSITRAKRELYFTTCRNRQIWGRTEFFPPSMFISEIPNSMLEIIDTIGVSTYSNQAPTVSSPKYKLGTPVYHEDYGSGVIAKNGLAGGEVFLIIQFESGKTGRFLPNYDNHLEIFGNDEWI